MNAFRQTYRFISAITAVLILFSYNGNSQNINEKAITGTWDIQGTLMGDDGEGWLMPHKPSNPDCETDHSVFVEDHTVKEVKHNSDCQAKENTFDWKLDGNILTLTKGKRGINWHIKNIEGGKMTVGVQMRPGSEKRIYVVYKKRE